MAWQPLTFTQTSQGLKPLSDVRIGGTFMFEGEQWRRFEGGVRRQVGRAPKVLRQLALCTLVYITV